MQTKQRTVTALQPLNSLGKTLHNRVNTSITLPVNDDNKAKPDLKIKIQFKLNADAAQSVSVAGTFNNWDTKQLPLKKNDGAWTAELALPRGRYEYRFVVDGNWVADPNAGESVPNPYGSCNLLLNV